MEAVSANGVPRNTSYYNRTPTKKKPIPPTPITRNRQKPIPPAKPKGIRRHRSLNAKLKNRTESCSTSGPRPETFSKKIPLDVHFLDKTSIKVAVNANHSASAMKVLIFKDMGIDYGKIAEYGLYWEATWNLGQRKVVEVPSDSKPYDLHNKYADTPNRSFKFYFVEKSKVKAFKAGRVGTVKRSAWKTVKKVKNSKKFKSLRNKTLKASSTERKRKQSDPPTRTGRPRSNTTGSLEPRASCPSNSERISNPVHISGEAERLTNSFGSQSNSVLRPGSPMPNKRERSYERLDIAKGCVGIIKDQCTVIITNPRDSKRVVAAAKLVAGNTQKLITYAKHVSVLFVDYPVRQKQLLGHAKGIAKATARLAETTQRNSADTMLLVRIALELKSHCEELALSLVIPDEKPRKSPQPALSIDSAMDRLVPKGRAKSSQNSSNQVGIPDIRGSRKNTAPVNRNIRDTRESVDEFVEYGFSRDIKSLPPRESLPEEDDEDVDALLAEFQNEIQQDMASNGGARAPDGVASANAQLADVSGLYDMISELETQSSPTPSAGRQHLPNVPLPIVNKFFDQVTTNSERLSLLIGVEDPDGYAALMAQFDSLDVETADDM